MYFPQGPILVGWVETTETKMDDVSNRNLAFFRSIQMLVSVNQLGCRFEMSSKDWNRT